MANNKSIQILRGTKGFDPATSDEILLDGQPFYSKKTKKLYIGDGVTELRNLQGTDIGLNIENGEGLFSLQQKISEEGDENYAYGMRNFIAGGHKNKTYQRNSTAIGGGNQAGLTESEFNTRYPSGFDENNRPYSTSYGWCFAIGQDNKTLGKNAYVTGYHNTANDLHDYIYGWYNTLHGSDQFTVGEFNNSNGYRNYSIGYNNLVGEFNKSGTDNNGFTIYIPSKAIDQAFVLGAENKVNSRLTNIIGCGNKSVTGHNNIVGTSNEIQAGERVSMLGYGLINYGLDGCVLLGTYNDKEYSTNPALIIGAGTSDSDRRNVFEVEKDGRAKVFGAPIYNNDVVRLKELDSLNIVGGEGLFSVKQRIDEEGDENYAYGMRNFIAGGHKNKTYQRNSTAIGGGNEAGLTEEEFNEKYPSGFDENNRPYSTSYGWAFVIGADNKAKANSTIVIGELNKAYGNRDKIVGWYNKLCGENQQAFGEYNHLGGYRNYGIGYGNFIGNFIKTGVDVNGYDVYELDPNDPSAKKTSSYTIGHINYLMSSNSYIFGSGNYSKGGAENVILGTENDVYAGAKMAVLGHGLKRAFQPNGNDGSDRCVLLGCYNAQRSDLSRSAALILGAGSSKEDRKNVLEVYKDGDMKVTGGIKANNLYISSTDKTNMISGSTNTINGTTYIQGDTQIGASSTGNTKNLTIYGNISDVTGTSKFTGNVGIGASSNDNYKLYTKGNSYFDGFIDISKDVYILENSTRVVRSHDVYNYIQNLPYQVSTSSFFAQNSYSGPSYDGSGQTGKNSGFCYGEYDASTSAIKTDGITYLSGTSFGTTGYLILGIGAITATIDLQHVGGGFNWSDDNAFCFVINSSYNVYNATATYELGTYSGTPAGYIGTHITKDNSGKTHVDFITDNGIDEIKKLRFTFFVSTNYN